MELHIQRLQDRISYKRQNRLTIMIFLIILIGCSIGLVCINFHWSSIGIIIALGILCLEFIVIAKKKKMNKLQQTISSDLVIIDENHRFFYQNRIFDLTSLKKVQYDSKVIIAFFEDFILYIEYDRDVVNYFQSLCTKVIDSTMTPKRKMSMLLLILLVVAFCSVVMKLITGVGYCLLMNTYLIDWTGLWIELIIILVVIISIGLVLIMKKHSFPIYLIGCIIIGLFIVLPPGKLNYFNYHDQYLAYRIDDKQLTLYDNVRYLFGQKVFEIDTNFVQRVGLFEDVFYVAYDDTYKFYAMNKIIQDQDSFIDEYEGCIYGNEWMNLVIKQHQVVMNQNVCEVSLVGNQILYISDELHDYLIQLDNDECKIYQLDRQYNNTLRINPDLFEEDLNKQETEQSISTNESTDSSQEESNQESYEIAEEEKDQQRYASYTQLLEVDDISTIKSDENLIKVQGEDDIYQAVKSIDQEITRIDNSEGIILDVQILDMTIYSQNDDQYGVYITRRIDSSVAESQTVQDIILMRKQDQNYVGTRFYSVRFMPSTHQTHNEPYDTSWTTDYLYRVDGHNIVDNAW